MALYSLSLCAGVGGLDLAVELACPGVFTPAALVEGEAYAACILAARMQDAAIPPAPIWSDMRTVCDAGFRDYVRERTGGQGIDFVYGGIPCQPHSVAGKQLGAADERDLWPATVQILETYRPWLFFLENVPGMLGYVSSRAIPDLQRLGYIVPRPILLEASEVGAPQKRERLFVLAYSPRIRAHGRERPRSGSGGGVCKIGATDSSTMADPASGGLGELRQPSGGDGQHAGSGRAMGEPSGRRRRKRVKGRGSDRGEAAGRAGDVVGDSIGSRRTPAGIGRDINAGKELEARSGVPYWPPGPASRDEWARVIAARPDFAPATVESAVRGVAARTAAGLVSTRTDELRCLGNLVVPLQGAAAFLIMLDRLKELIQ